MTFYTRCLKALHMSCRATGLLMLLAVASARAGDDTAQVAPRRSLLQDFVSKPGFVIPTEAPPPTEAVPTQVPAPQYASGDEWDGASPNEMQEGDSDAPTLYTPWSHPNLMPTDAAVPTVYSPNSEGTTDAPAPTDDGPPTAIQSGINSLIGNLMTWTKAPTPLPPWKTSQPTAGATVQAEVVPNPLEAMEEESVGEGSGTWKYLGGMMMVAAVAGVTLVSYRRGVATGRGEASEAGETVHLLQELGPSARVNYRSTLPTSETVVVVETL